MINHKLIFIMFGTLTIISQVSLALDPFEIHVHSDELAETGHANVELNVNSFLKGRTEPEYEGELPPNGVTHLATEASFGLTKFWEVGANVQTALDSNATGHFGGFKMRSKFAMPRADQNIVSYSLNVETGYSPFKFKEDGWVTELRPIVCLEGSRWHWHVNPIFGWAMSGKNGLTPDLEFATKIGYRTGLGFTLGAEHLAEFGQINAIPALGEQEHVTFLVSEIEADVVDIAVGVGRGLTTPSPEWITKITIGKSI